MSKCIFTNKNYKIIKIKGYNNKYKYIVFNRNKKFEDAHTHVPNVKYGKILIYCCLTGEFPDSKKAQRLKNNYRFIESLIRICTNKYYNKFKKIFDELEQKNDYT